MIGRLTRRRVRAGRDRSRREAQGKAQSAASQTRQAKGGGREALKRGSHFGRRRRLALRARLERGALRVERAAADRRGGARQSALDTLPPASRHARGLRGRLDTQPAPTGVARGADQGGGRGTCRVRACVRRSCQIWPNCQIRLTCQIRRSVARQADRPAHLAALTGTPRGALHQRPTVPSTDRLPDQALPAPSRPLLRASARARRRRRTDLPTRIP